MAWHPGAVRVLIRSRLGWTLKGGTHRRPVNKLLWHTTEGDTAEAAFGAYRSRAGLTSGVHPHFTYDPVRDRLYQHIDTDRASYSLKSGDTDGVIQVEIVGRAGQSHGWDQVVNERLGRLAGWIFGTHPGIDRHKHATFLGADAGLLAARYPRGKARMSPRQWATFSGSLGHQHAPYDDHWDPGALNIDAVLAAANPFPEGDDNDMLDLINDPNNQRMWATWVTDGTTHVDEYSTYLPTAGKPCPNIGYVIDAQVQKGNIVKAG